MHVLGRMIEAVKPEGLILDLQVIRPDPTVERDGCIVAGVDGDPLFQWADAATAAVDARIEAGYLVEEAVDDHDVFEHYANGVELVERFATSKRRLADQDVLRIRALDGPSHHAGALPPPATTRHRTPYRGPGDELAWPRVGAGRGMRLALSSVVTSRADGAVASRS